MRCPKCGTEVPVDSLNCPKCKLLTPKGRTSRNLSLKKDERHDKLAKVKHYGMLAAVIIVVLGIVGYGYIVLSSGSSIEPKTALQAMDTLRRMPSNQEGLTVDDYMEQARKESEQAGRLIRYRGWHVKPMSGISRKILIVYSFEEQNGIEQRAEWVADTSSNTFIPQTNLARGAYNR